MSSYYCTTFDHVDVLLSTKSPYTSISFRGLSMADSVWQQIKRKVNNCGCIDLSVYGTRITLSIARQINKMHNLRSIDLSSCFIDDDAFKCLMTGLLYNNNIISITLNYVDLSGVRASLIADLIEKNSKILSLHLDRSKMSRKEINHVLRSFLITKNIKSFSLDGASKQQKQIISRHLSTLEKSDSVQYPSLRSTTVSFFCHYAYVSNAKGEGYKNYLAEKEAMMRWNIAKNDPKLFAKNSS